MKYKDALKQSMTLLSEDSNCRFLGYNVKYGSKINGTLKDIDENKLIETPVAENLMAGMAIGMSIEGLKPVVCFERFDFILNALDSIVNHLDKMNVISKGEYDPKVIIRVVIGSIKKPLFTGITHTQDLTESISKMVNFPVIKLSSVDEVIKYYYEASKWKSSMMLIEERDRYEEE
jgi:pyruvate/2-oxoglutarate/acetoin dehydrogenase E1 component